MLNNLPDPVPLSNLNYSEMISRDVLDIGYNLEATKIIVGKGVWSNGQDTDTADSVDEQFSDDTNAKNRFYYSADFPSYYPEEFKSIARHLESYLNQNVLPTRQKLSYFAKNWNWSHVEIRRGQQGELMVIVPLNPFNLTTVHIS